MNSATPKWDSIGVDPRPNGYDSKLAIGARDAGNEKWNDPKKIHPIHLVVSLKRVAGFIPTFATEHQQENRGPGKWRFQLLVSNFQPTGDAKNGAVLLASLWKGSLQTQASPNSPRHTSFV